MFCLGHLNAAELALDDRRQDAPRSRELKRLHQVRAVLLDVQSRRLHFHVVNSDAVELGVARGLIIPDNMKVPIDVVQAAQLGLGTRRGLCSAHLLPAVRGGRGSRL